MKHSVKYFAMAAIVAALTACGGDDNDNDEPKPESKPDWHLEWTDDFESPELDPTVWHRCDRGGSDWNNNMSKEDCCYGHDSTNGAVILRGLKRPDNVDDDQEYIVGGIETSGLKAFVPPFRLEIRAKLGAAQGAWPALWLMPFESGEGWPQCGEIDIMERLNYNNLVYQTVHSGYTQNNNTNPVNSRTAMINGDAWNVYSITVTKSAVLWEINGKETHRYNRLTPEVAGQFPFNKPWHLKMDMQLGGSWVGPVTGDDLPVEMAIDYVKYYRYYKK